MEELHSVDEHFRGRSPAVREIYDSILAVSRKLGGFKEEAKKTSIHLVNRTAFAGIQTRREYLILTFKSDQDIDSDRIIKREHVSANRWYHATKLSSAKDLDAELKQWLKRAYVLSAFTGDIGSCGSLGG